MGLFQLQELGFKDESSFGEDLTTIDTIIPVTSINFVPSDERVPDQSILARPNDQLPGFLAPHRGDDLEFTFYWAGANQAMTSSFTETWQMTLLGDGFGGLDTSGVGTTISGTSSTATALDVTSVTGLGAGEIVRIGAHGDGRGDGQAVAISSVDAGATPDDLNLLTATPAAPTTAGDVVYATGLFWPQETLGNTKRFLVGNTTTDAQWYARGCQLASATLATDYASGGFPMWTLRYRVAQWERATTTIPTGTAISSCDYAPIAGGSVFINSHGTATRATVSPSRVALTLDMDLREKVGPGGVHPRQIITGYERGFVKPKLSMDIPFSTTYQSAFDSDGSDSSLYHILVTLNPTHKRSVGFYLPRAFLSGVRPTRTEFNGMVYQTVEWTGRESAVTTSELTKSAVRFFIG